jgi:glycosyltransferase involved in cell wall biosynthesis
MHILLIHQAFASIDEPGGTRHHEFARELARQGHKVTIIASPISYLTGEAGGRKIPWIQKQTDEFGVTILRTYTYPAFHKSFFHRVIGFISFMVSSFFAGVNVRKVDLVWGTSPPIFQGITAWALARIKRVPFLFEVRDLWPAFAIGVGVLKQPVLIKLSLWLEKFLYRNADRIVVNSPGYLEHVRSRGARVVELVPNGADPAMFNPDGKGETFRKKYALEDDFIVLYAGAHGMSNDLDVVLNAAKKIIDLDIVKVVFLGDGKEKQHLMEKACEMSLSNVRFIPSLPKTEMAEALAASNACIAILKPLDLYQTTYPNKVFDYMAAGRPIILAIDGVIRQVVEGGQAGIFVEPGNADQMAAAVRKLYGDRNLASVMGKNGRKILVEQFSRPDMCEKLKTILMDMTRQPIP